MADTPTTTANLADILHTETIIPEIQSMARPTAVTLGLITQVDITGKTTLKARFNRYDAVATVSAGVAETASVDAQALSMTNVEVTVAENVVVRKVSNKLLKASAKSIDEWRNEIVQLDGKDLWLAVNNDVIGLFDELTTTQGDSATDWSCDSHAAAIGKIEAADQHPEGRKLVAVYHPNMCDQMRRDAMSSGAAIMQTAAAGMLNVNGTLPGVAFDYLGVPTFQCSQVDESADTLGWTGAMFPAANDARDPEGPFALVTLGGVDVFPDFNGQYRHWYTTLSYTWGQGTRNAGRGCGCIGKKNA